MNNRALLAAELLGICLLFSNHMLLRTAVNLVPTRLDTYLVGRSFRHPAAGRGLVHASIVLSLALCILTHGFFAATTTVDFNGQHYAVSYRSATLTNTTWADTLYRRWGLIDLPADHWTTNEPSVTLAERTKAHALAVLTATWPGHD
ncbi:hypothetical protein [Lacticaseibacillus absianus]|uniref:hypothetical protein n=1 Tax=Lacticaseibacillus absianus TaxID=2729623 RepID=UPI0015CB2C46|nr:hypothetical protein [Lacticaseibacillus absianus]